MFREKKGLDGVDVLIVIVIRRDDLIAACDELPCREGRVLNPPEERTFKVERMSSFELQRSSVAQLYLE